MATVSISKKTIIVLLAIAAIGGFVLGRLSTQLQLRLPQGSGESELTHASSNFLLEDPGPSADGNELLDISSAPFLGPATAKITLVEFSDFQCGYCRRVISTVHELLELYPDDLRVVFLNLPLSFHENAEPAARAALAAHDQGAFWDYHDLLFRNQAALDGDSLEGYARALELDMEAFEAAFESEQVAEQVAIEQGIGGRLGINGTPSFMVNGVSLIGAVPVDEFRTVIDRELEAVNELLESGVPLSEVFRRRVDANLGGSREQESGRADDRRAPESARNPAETEDPIEAGPVIMTVFVDSNSESARAITPSLERLEAEFGAELVLHVRDLEEVEETERSERNLVATPAIFVGHRRLVGVVPYGDLEVAVRTAMRTQ